MKRLFLLLPILLLSLLSLAFKDSSNNLFPLFGYTIAVDVGHGDLDPGSIYGTEYEKDYNLLFSKDLVKVLESYGASVIVTRDGDYDLSNPSSSRRKKSDFDNRIALIDSSKSDLYLSLHMNYLKDSSYFGAQAFYSSTNSANEKIASTLQKNLNKFFNFDKDYKKIGNDKYLYKNIKTKGALLEFGFISNYRDRKNLKSEEYRYELSKVIANSLIEYFNGIG